MIDGASGTRFGGNRADGASPRLVSVVIAAFNATATAGAVPMVILPTVFASLSVFRRGLRLAAPLVAAFVGGALLLVLFGSNLVIALDGTDGPLTLRLAAAQAGVATLNHAHMRLWSIEGPIGYAVVFGATWAMWRPQPLTSTLRPGGAGAPTSSWT